MPRKARGWLRRRIYAEGEVFLFCYYVSRSGENAVENSQLIGLVRDFPTEDDAWREVQLKGYWKLADPSLSISPTFGEIAQHFRLYDLKRNGALSKRARETITTHESMLDGYILPKWGQVRALEMTVPMIEMWFEDLAAKPIGRNYAEGEQPPNGYEAKPLEWTSIVKIRSTMSLVFSHALRHRLIEGGKEVNPFRNPKKEGGVRCITVSDYEATVVTTEQMIMILHFLDTETTQMEWTMALLLGATALRPEEGFGIKWGDIDFGRGQINLSRAWSKGHETNGKNQSALVPVAIHTVLADSLQEWRRQSPYPNDGDWVFPSLTLRGTVPRSASTAGQKYLRPAAEYAGVIEKGSSKRFGWHNLRHSLATFLAGEVNPAVTMKILRHKRLATTLGIYTHAQLEKHRDAQGIFLRAIKRGKPSELKPSKRSR